MTATEGLMAAGVGISGGLLVKENHCLEINGIFSPFGILPLTDVDTDTELSFYNFNLGYSYRFRILKDFITIAPGLLLGYSDRPVIYGAWGFRNSNEPRPYAGERATRWQTVTVGVQADIELGRDAVRFVCSGRGQYAKPSEFMLQLGFGVALFGAMR